MTVYWDTSAIIHYYSTGRLQQVAGVTRTHTLAELFSALTGRGVQKPMKDGSVRHKRLSMKLAAKLIAYLRGRLTFVDLSPDEVLAAIQDAKNVNAQGGRIHDLLHAVAADKAKADELWTLDRNDFAGLGKAPIKQL
jgi:predicted nucleic acid-binding protein